MGRHRRISTDMNVASAQASIPGDLAARTCVVVPAYNEGAMIGTVAAALVSRGFDVVVVDDASSDDTASRAAAAGATALRHIINRGQGAALATGIAHALARRAEFVVTFDADGQHDSDEIFKLLEPLAGGNFDVALGSRFLRANSTIPPGRRLLLRAAILFTRAASGLPVTDTHNGLRAMTARAASLIRIRQDRMAHASEILDEIRDHGLRWCEVPVTITYTEYSRRKGQSHLGLFRILVDYIFGRWTS